MVKPVLAYALKKAGARPFGALALFFDQSPFIKLACFIASLQASLLALLLSILPA